MRGSDLLARAAQQLTDVRAEVVLGVRVDVNPAARRTGLPLGHGVRGDHAVTMVERDAAGHVADRTQAQRTSSVPPSGTSEPLG